MRRRHIRAFWQSVNTPPAPIAWLATSKSAGAWATAMLLKLNPHGHIAEDPRQADLSITLTPMTSCRASPGSPASTRRTCRRCSWRGGEVPDSLGGTSELVLVDDGSSVIGPGGHREGGRGGFRPTVRYAVSDAGIIGAYLGRRYDQSKGRPLFLIRGTAFPAAKGSAPSRKQASTPPPPAAQRSR